MQSNSKWEGEGRKFNQLVPEGRNIYRIAKVSFKKKDQGKNSYERRVYESVDYESSS